ncbi:MAG: flagellar type III secretion system pore protein FliP [Planctomycetia bacterium]|nr:flagellar type III secretion system pore protein FliP [Planctomycetia bacterium]
MRRDSRTHRRRDRPQGLGRRRCAVAKLPALPLALSPPPRASWSRRVLAGAFLIVTLSTVFGPALAQEPANSPASLDPGAASALRPQGLVEQGLGRDGLSASLQILLLLTVISLAPAILMMTTSFIRVVVVLGLLRQALGTQQIPPTQVITGIALFITLLVMAPVWTEVYDVGVAPYSSGEITLEEAWQRGQEPVRRFMGRQIERTDNTDDVWLFLDYMEQQSKAGESEKPKYTHLYGADAAKGEQDVPLQVLLPAFMLSELKTAFLIGFQIYLPFLILDLVIATVLTSMGMYMLQPALVALPFKLLLFVLVDGWRLVVELLLLSFEPFS